LSDELLDLVSGRSKQWIHEAVPQVNNPNISFENTTIDYKPPKTIAHGLTITADLAGCHYPTTEDASSSDTSWDCPLSETSAAIDVTGTLDGIDKPDEGLYLMLFASNDWKTWWQASEVTVPGSQFRTDTYGRVPNVNTKACINHAGYLYLGGWV